MQKRAAVWGAAGLLVVGLTSLSADAQSARGGAVRVAGGITGGQRLEVIADQPSHFAVFAVGRGMTGNPIQVLTEESPDGLGIRPLARRLKAGQLSPAQLSRFAPASEVVVVVLASATKPELSGFATEGRWANDLELADSVASDGNRLIRELAGIVYGANVAYTARIARMDFAVERTVVAYQPPATNECGEPVHASSGYQSSVPPASQPAQVRASFTAGTQWLANQFPASYRGVPADGRQVRQVTQLPGCAVLEFAPVPIPPVLPGSRPAKVPDVPSAGVPERP